MKSWSLKLLSSFVLLTQCDSSTKSPSDVSKATEQHSKVAKSDWIQVASPRAAIANFRYHNFVDGADIGRFVFGIFKRGDQGALELHFDAIDIPEYSDALRTDTSLFIETELTTEIGDVRVHVRFLEKSYSSRVTYQYTVKSSDLVPFHYPETSDAILKTMNNRFVSVPALDYIVVFIDEEPIYIIAHLK